MPLYVCDATEKKLYEVGLDGSSPTALFTTSAQAPYYPFYEPTVNKFFYAKVDLYVIDYDGSNETRIINAGNNLSDCDVDTVNSKVYYGIIADKEVRTCDYDGGNDAQDFTTSGSIRGLQVDVANGHVYWAAAATLYRTDIGGGNETVIYADGGTIIEQFDLDLVNGKIYWCNSTNDLIRRCNLDGSSPETIVTTGVSAWGCAVDGAGGKVYWTESAPKNVKRANLDGTSQEVIWAGSTFPAYLYVVGSGAAARKTRWGPWVYLSGPGRSFGQSHHTHP